MSLQGHTWALHYQRTGRDFWSVDCQLSYPLYTMILILPFLVFYLIFYKRSLPSFPLPHLSPCPLSHPLLPSSPVKSKPPSASAALPGASAPSKYVPPAQRGDKKGESLTSRLQQDDQATVRVTNLSEETQESDLRELFGYFGLIKRVFLAKDKQTQQSKVSLLYVHCLIYAAGKSVLMPSTCRSFWQGFAFVSYDSKRSAQKAIDSLNGYGYDHLILKVEWAK